MTHGSTAWTSAAPWRSSRRDLLAFEDGAPDDDSAGWTQAALEKVNDGSADIDLGPPERVDGVMVP